MRTVAVIQARMGSNRLPGKVLMPLAGKPVLWHIVHRLRKCRYVDAIAIATSTSSTDDPIEKFAVHEGIEVVRGSEDNVLARYLLAAERLGAEIIVRVTGDAPLIDPATIDRVVGTLIETKSDYCMGDPQVPSIHEGFSPFTSLALRKLVQEAGDDPAAKEHVTAYFKEHPEFVRVVKAPTESDCQFIGARVSVDTPADLRFLEEVYSRLNIPVGEVDVRDVVRLLRSEPELLKINAHVHRKTAHERSRKILFRCDGDGQLGLGHVYRSLALADELRDSHGYGVSFAMATGPVGFELVSSAGYPIERNNGDCEDIWLDRLVQQLRPDALLLDVRSELPRSSVEKWRSNGLLIVTLDDPSQRRLAANLAFYPPVPQVQKLDWSDFDGQLYVGWEWVVLRREFAQRHPSVPHEHPVVLVTMGGSDPAGLTLQAVEALDLLVEDFETIVLLGPGFSHDAALRDLLRSTRRHFDVRLNTPSMPNLMSEVDLAVASFGVTAYELAAMGVPAIYLCLTQDHSESALAFVKAGMAVCLGVFTSVKEQMLAETVRYLLHDVSGRSRMARRAIHQVDARGAARIAHTVGATLKRSNG